MFVEFTHFDGSGTKVLVAIDTIAYITEADKIIFTLKDGSSNSVAESYEEVKQILLAATLPVGTLKGDY
jgi:hypothetical protein